MPPLPKDPALRQRRNKASTRATLDPEANRTRRAPKLPNVRVWSRMTLSWWRDVWRSPMASEFLEADRHALYRLAVLVDSFWVTPGKELANEIAKEEQRFGLTPLDRRRLEWEIKRVEQAERKVAPPRPRVNDPLAGLRMVK